MEINECFDVQEIGSVPSQSQKFSIISNFDSLTIVTQNKKDFLKIHYVDDKVFFKWGFSDDRSGTEKEVFLWFQGRRFGITGSQEGLQQLYKICQGKFVFICSEFARSKEKQNLTNIQTYIIKHKKQYFTEDEFARLIYNQECDWANIVEIPEEIKIIKSLSRHKNPFLPQIQNIQFNGHLYFVSYQQKEMDSLKKILVESKDLSLCLIIRIVHQILKVLDFFEQIKLVHNGLELQNIMFDGQEQQIQIQNYTSAFFQQTQPAIRKGQSLGCIPPECFQKNQLITTKANIFKLGVIFYQLIFKKNPFGTIQAEILENNINGFYQGLQISDLQFSDKIYRKIIMLLKSMLSYDPSMRKYPREYLQNELFQPKIREKLSKYNFLQNEKNEKNDIDIHEGIVKINNVRSIQVKFK